ncbi:metalloregulator ArsR/SmtB family transcription factor [Streptomyces sp. A3M-1-3]|uniref:ArsR/SmtB family transcription factor n=1 Tax=Streptomyces sp. A3M-1-3 TaxID=2962044 RepID=UPI0020B85DD2|nr:metalloregulator ArsR/SmtB family transcription factor [Streptomyces sp. A3M-1-3]MCP3818836.1 metalloregulator ArsR/SmtB family transcription factor [Streptomyces sp. A3M-1-3]
MNPTTAPAPLQAPPAVPVGEPAGYAALRALAHPTRLRLLEFILRGERTSAECAAYAGISQPRVSVQLSCLVGCGYVSARRDGRKLRYSIGDPRIADLLVLARALAADNAAALARCPSKAAETQCMEEDP